MNICNIYAKIAKFCVAKLSQVLLAS